MNRFYWYAGLLLVSLFVVGCGPMSRPIPERLNDVDQKSVNEAWNRALTPVGKHDRQTWLDVFVTAYAHEVGVDRLTFRSEKDLATGKVVMEVFFERAKPADDRFVVTVYDAAGKVVRTEKYNRDEVTRAVEELHPKGNPPPAGVEKRMQRVQEIMPKNEPK
ncbi:hypothetical protein [Limnoglobus roseus]|uniref:Lipoprotein n=1 Tax=Limnoglobus roseus TaxID=2598579 RepID=A0A5C1A400_9BACT|nr:hypothetical protein [Limnoglobus roseus]QEL13811.1 hypothetical protein PX52LOC_00669 [Limnoglobus roseus]